MTNSIPILIIYACVFILMSYDVYLTLKEYKDYSSKEKLFAKLAIFIMICTLAFPWFVCMKENKQPNIRVPYNPTYTKPEIADSTRHDWVKDENVCIERRLVYEQMLNEKLAR